MTRRSDWLLLLLFVVLVQANILLGRPAPTGRGDHWPLQNRQEPQQDPSLKEWDSELQHFPFLSPLNGTADHLFLGSDHHQDHVAHLQSSLQHQGEQDKLGQVPVQQRHGESGKEGSSKHQHVAERRKRPYYKVSELTEEQLAHLSVDDRILVLTSADKTSGGKRKRRKELLEKVFSEETPKSGKDDHGPCGLMPSQDQEALREKAHECHQILQKDHNELRYIATPSRKLYTLSIDIAKKNENTIRWLIEKYPKIRTADKREEVFERTIRKLEMTRETKDPQDPGNEEEQQQASKGVSPACSREKGKQIDSEEIPWTSYRRSFKLRDGEGKVLSPLQTYLFSVNAARLSPARRKHKNDLIDMFRIWRRTGDRPKMPEPPNDLYYKSVHNLQPSSQGYSEHSSAVQGSDKIVSGKKLRLNANTGLKGDLIKHWKEEAAEKKTIISKIHGDRLIFIHPDGTRASVSLDDMILHKEDVEIIVQLWQIGKLNRDEAARRLYKVSKKPIKNQQK
ncbi:hypothetical protein FA10DRAFT_257918 [Acaromyces ingoldii]|uniref:Chalcone isomerase domain-containing protein n=1 Tax=Acaromyces ingoldii TaxID=215250 RepID=A0A316YWY1_9BASI|nr:hypothetical protein FA10DRAFT_257918 [Acaromyces ingoldii]PWN93671.1 hypothetical protein FA10DRAFT_257918 [Acaromyces ingoldii]